MATSFSPPAAYVAVDGCPRLYGWLVTPPFIGVHVFTDRLAFAAADRIQIQICTIGIHGFKLISYALGMDQSEHHRRLAFAVADWCLRQHGWPIMPLLLGVHAFTDRLPRPSPAGVFAYTVGWSHHRCWASTSSPTGLPLPPSTGVSACMAGLSCRCCWASTPSPTGRLVRRRLLAYYAAVDGHLHLHRRLASVVADSCFHQHSWLVTPPLLGVYVFTDRLAFAAVDWCLRLHSWPIMPPLLDVYIFLDQPSRMTPTGAIVFTAGHVAATANRRHHLQRKLSTSAADWFLHFRGCMILPVLIGLIVFPAGRLVCC
uniref:cysteine dioxygenase n=1 Tax=Oryza sativa subsp. japonica TaxID=39947 RepID=Q6YSZ1_ORYSJ|nr:HGWP repeat containing protein-like [Oryza sativa Japonica Group]BAD30647.1 HGWP repeat containing protein-like [Oryza sativa Japonica Group]